MISTSATFDIANGTVPAPTPEPLPPAPGDYEVIEGKSVSGSIPAGTHHKLYRDCTFGSMIYINENCHHITIERASIKKLYITSAWDVKMYDVMVDGAGKYHANGNQIKRRSTSYPIPARILLDGVTFKNFRKDPATDDHCDGLHIFTGEDITIRNGTFENNEHFHILWTKYGGPTPVRQVLEDSWFGQIGLGYYAVQLGGGHGEAFDDVLIQRNVVTDKSVNMGTQNTLNNIRVLNNKATIVGCGRAGVTCQGNT